MFFVSKRSANTSERQQQYDVGHPVVATGRGVHRLSSSISADVWAPLKSDLKPHSSYNL
ncbi:hypothetical protein [Lysinibacillus xylanilyticus]|uniref:hypothetical protein n=1 Tax=Lysinibacillus xylanilyticus TaxID=582475 RepID=UPI003CFCA440